MSRLPKGVLVRDLANWQSTSLMGAWATNGPCVGNLTSIFVYNNSTTGSILLVHGINYAVGNSCQIFFKRFIGQSGNLVTGIGAPAPIDPRTGVQAGQLYTQAQATPAGVGFGAVTAFANVAYDYEPDHPIAILPPGYSFSLETNITNVILDAGFRWSVVPRW